MKRTTKRYRDVWHQLCLSAFTLAVFLFFSTISYQLLHSLFRLTAWHIFSFLFAKDLLLSSSFLYPSPTCSPHFDLRLLSLPSTPRPHSYYCSPLHSLFSVTYCTPRQNFTASLLSFAGAAASFLPHLPVLQ
ncbi:hypothetical protein CC80DRAFT_27795 [Byssothecium circinans]|uniref:Uncharacterized protein n=1 Tax=Byssothecium circinans TaxID=147558 RepID=A0A6A5U0Z7_9PLEO|nr:hypothetical protein CC80DRAFT_27795 [Byssothecium circinans]